MIFLLASYPKSGNTWMRALIQAFETPDQAVDINQLGKIPVIMSRKLFDQVLDVDSGDLTAAEMAGARPEMNRILAQENHGVSWYKSHDSLLPPPGCPAPPFDGGSLGGVVLIVRDPRDVAPSLADHNGHTVDHAIDVMADENYHLPRINPFRQLPHFVSSWSRFNQSWLDAPPPIRLLVIRYEDLSADPARCLMNVLEFAGITADRARCQAAAAATRFDMLAQQETEHGFRELSQFAQTRFFRHGQVGGWRTALNAQQISRIAYDHGSIMLRFGYTL